VLPTDVVGLEEMNLVLADELRDGNVPAVHKGLPVAKAAFASLLSTVDEYCFRGDSACHEHGLIASIRRPAAPLVGWTVASDRKDHVELVREVSADVLALRCQPRDLAWREFAFMST